ncbi:recombinase RecT [Gordonia bronchialis]|uniref:recombinase RecT n=1 Tax=Gordonia bronchialis TaxID=2054 RepID=UPI001CBFB0BF|nr:recombinase RecT [Gordonia bronchialis]UAK38342.1 recombinase RecT [Gordonia bronchialis]
MSNEVESAEKPGASRLIELYASDFAQALPRHLDGSQWVRQSLAAIRKNSDIYKAANNNPPQAMRVLMEAARLGHTPGTDQFYLIPRGNKDLGYEDYVNGRGETKKRKRQELTGIESYRGIISRMYRGGVVKSVIVELVRDGDQFVYNPGVHDRPQHEVDWFGDRGKVKGGYAFAVMDGGAISRVVVMSTEQINEHRARSDSWKNSWSRESSPWTTDWEAMAMKTLVRQLEKWTLTSTEWREQQMRLAELARQPESEPAPEEPIEAEVVSDESDTVDEEPDDGEG